MDLLKAYMKRFIKIVKKMKEITHIAQLSKDLSLEVKRGHIKYKKNLDVRDFRTSENNN